MINAIRKLFAPIIAGPSIDQALAYFYTVDTCGGSHLSAQSIKQYEHGAFFEFVRIEFVNYAGRCSMDVWLEPCMDGACYGEW